MPTHTSNSFFFATSTDDDLRPDTALSSATPSYHERDVSGSSAEPSSANPNTASQRHAHHHSSASVASFSSFLATVPGGGGALADQTAAPANAVTSASGAVAFPGQRRSRSHSRSNSITRARRASIVNSRRTSTSIGTGAGSGINFGADGLQPPLPHPRSSSGVRESFMAPPPMAARPTSASARSSFMLGAAGHGRMSSEKDSSLAKPPREMPARMRSHLLGEAPEKPWLSTKDVRVRASWWLTIAFMLVGLAAAAIRIYFGFRDVRLITEPLCLILQDDFDQGSIDTSVWQHEIDLGGFGNGEFEMTTDAPENAFVEDGILYLVPTLTSDVIGRDAIFDNGGQPFNLTGCTNTNLTACGVVANSTTRTVVNPVRSARLNTKESRSIQFGKVEIRAKLPRGDWIWPALWMLPVNDTYGPWPASGEIDIMESRGNGPEYERQGRNYVRSSLNWGPLSFLNGVYKTFGYWVERRQSFDQGFHTYSLEWTPDFIRAYVDTRLKFTLNLRFDRPFFDRGNFPRTVFNGSSEIVVPNPWAGGSFATPFDKPFYLILNVAVGGTNGWFPDGIGEKPWLDGSNTAMYDFAKAQDEWYSTWPTDPKERALAIDSVKMWQICQ